MNPTSPRIGRLWLAALLVAAVGGGLSWVTDPLPTGRPVLAGEVRVVDGDSLVLEGERVRLIGIDAPETRQTCLRHGLPWSCGLAATEALRRAVAQGPVTCRAEGTDRNGRWLARCATPGTPDIGAALVAAGWAVSYDATYGREEAAARSARRGLWDSTFERPQAWRRARRGEAG